MAIFNVTSLTGLQTALASSAANGEDDVINLTADISAAGASDFTTGTGGRDLLQVAITDGMTLSIVGGGHILDANSLGRVIEISSGTVSVSNLTIREGAAAGNGGDFNQAGDAGLGGGINNAGNLTLTNVTVTANAASGGGGGGAAGGGAAGGGYSGGGGGGGGGVGAFAAAGGAGRAGSTVFAGHSANGQTGGQGGAGLSSYAGGGGSSTGGRAGIYYSSEGSGGNGAVASSGGISVGGGGGGAGDARSAAAGGAAAGGIFNSGTLLITGGTITGNIAAGGGGGGAYNGATSANGGAGVGGIQNTGVLRLDGVTFSANVGAGGQAGHSSGGPGSTGASSTDTSGAAAMVNQAHTGGVSISGTATQGQTLTAASTLADGNGLGTLAYQWKSDGTNIVGATASSFTLSQGQVGHLLTVTSGYTDGAGFVESATSSATGSVSNVNDAPTGTVTISGTAAQGQTLTATNSLADTDGLGTISYLWKSDGAAISGATASTLVLGHAQVGHAITVAASYTDGFGAAESVSSAATGTVNAVNSAPTGAVTISGAATQGQTLTASNTLADADGLGTISYQWKSDGAVISGAAASTLILGQAQVGHAITAIGSYTDGLGTAESAISSATASVSNINDAPTGAVSINGTATPGQTLTASNTLADADGLGTISYQWRSDGVNIGGATGSTFTLTDAQNGHAVTVAAHYTDGFGTPESVTSADLPVAAPPPPADPDHVPPPPVQVVITAAGAIVTGDASANLISWSTVGADTVSAGAGDDTLIGGPNADALYANAGNDSISGGGDPDLVRGGQGNDFANGNQGNDLIFGDLGNDTIIGGQGEDVIQGNQGRDLVVGDLGADTLLGGQDDDVLQGGAGDDYLSGDRGDDLLTGGPGADTFSFKGGLGRDTVTDFSHAQGDHILLDRALAADFQAVTASMTMQGADTVITLQGETIVLAGINMSTLTAGDFLFA